MPRTDPTLKLRRDRVRWLRDEIERTDKLLEDARSRDIPPLIHQRRFLSSDLFQAQMELAQQLNIGKPAKSLTPEQFDTEFRSWLETADLDLLERAVEMWANRVGAVIVVEGGKPHLRYREAS